MWVQPVAAAVPAAQQANAVGSGEPHRASSAPAAVPVDLPRGLTAEQRMQLSPDAQAARFQLEGDLSGLMARDASSSTLLLRTLSSAGLM